MTWMSRSNSNNGVGDRGDLVGIPRGDPGWRLTSRVPSSNYGGGYRGDPVEVPRGDPESSTRQEEHDRSAREIE